MHKKYINVYLVDIRVQRFYEWLQHLVLDTLTKYIFRFRELQTYQIAGSAAE